MNKTLRTLSNAFLFVVAGMTSLSVSAQESVVLYEQTFDDQSQFEEGATLPKGWTSNSDNAFNVVNGEEWGFMPYSGENLLVANPSYSAGREDVTFTSSFELKAGENYDISFYVNLQQGSRLPSFKFTVGTGQEVAAQTVVLKSYENTTTSGWEQVVVSFTPEATAEYNFAFWACSMLSNDGFMMVDDFMLKGPAAEPAWTATLPYVETFDDASHYTGDAAMPNGWVALGSSPFSTVLAMDYGRMADTGENVIVSGYPQTSNRQDVAFSPMLDMKAGYEYKIKVKYMMPGLNGRTGEMKITVGMGQSYETHLAYSYYDRDKTVGEWTTAEFTYVPSQDGQYSVGLWACSTLSSAGDVFYDTFSIEEIEPEPEPAWEATLPYMETFDDASHFVEGATLPNGWVSNSDNAFNVLNGEDWGFLPNSGANLLVANPSYSSGREDVTFTPMLEMTGGVAYKISFYVNLQQGSRMPSFKFTVGNGQEVAAHSQVLKSYENTTTSGWEKVEVEFTPESTGEYCFAFWACSMLSNDGFMMVDDFSIEQEEEEVPEWTPSIPYMETFDEASHYDGLSFLPIGWLATGDEPFVTGNVNDVPAVSGEYYLIAPSSIIPERRDIAYTPLLTMEAGVEYVVSFYLYLPGGTNPASFKFTVGREQAYDMQTELFAVSDQLMSGWDYVELSFTPETTAEYCFGFWADSESTDDGYYCFDNFSLRKAEEVLPPSGTIYMSNTWNSIFDGRPMVFPNVPYKLIANVDNATGYLWSVTGSAQISDPTVKEPTISFTESGSYTITLEAENKGGSTEITRNFICQVIPEDGFETTAISTTNESYDKVYQQNDIPAFREDGTVQAQETYDILYHYVVGVNRYYRAFAERFDMPAGQSVDVSSVSFNMMRYGLYVATTGTTVTDDTEKEVKLVLYGEKDGRPDTANPFFEKSYKLTDVFGSSGIYKWVMISMQLGETVTVTGPFYVALEFDPLQMDLDKEWTVGSYFAADTRRHINGQTSLYVKPEAAIEGSEFVPDGGYYKADEFSRELEGYSFAAMPWIAMTGLSSVDNLESAVRFYTSLDGNNVKVDGVKAGDKVAVYSVSGMLMATVEAASSTVVIPVADWAKGVYVLTVNGQSVKFVK